MSALTVATLNLKKGELRWDERAPPLVRQLVALRPDIIGFQEIHLPIDQGNWICQRANELLSLVGAPLCRIHHMANPRENAALEALGIMTHLPVLQHEGFDYLIRNRVAHFISVETPDGRSLDFWNTHFHHEQDDAGHEMRQEQAEKLSAWINGRSHGSPLVLVGDFNCVPGTRPVRTIWRAPYFSVRCARPGGAYDLSHAAGTEAISRALGHRPHLRLASGSRA